MSVATPACASAPGVGEPLGEAFFARPAPRVARDLLGCVLRVGECAGTIVETEAYDQDDPASHSHRGSRGRARVMFGPPGTIYIYRSYGMHWCMNTVCEPEGRGAGVLLRAIDPLEGREQMCTRRPGVPDRLLAAGPGRLCAALGIDDRLNGLPLGPGTAQILVGTPPAHVLEGPRIGISTAIETPWRFGVAGSRHLSRPFPAGSGQ